MIASLRWLRRMIFGVSPEETSFARRGFWAGEPGARQRLEYSGTTFLRGYHAALEEDTADALAVRLTAVEPEFRGFAFEGAAMGLAMLDLVTPWKRNRWASFAEGPGAAHIYMVHVGVGWALARFPRRGERTLGRLNPFLRWLAVDGYGFHEGYFHWRRALEGQGVPRRLSGYARRAFDQGLGRSLWFVDGADVTRMGAPARPPATVSSSTSGGSFCTDV